MNPGDATAMPPDPAGAPAGRLASGWAVARSSAWARAGIFIALAIVLSVPSIWLPGLLSPMFPDAPPSLRALGDFVRKVFPPLAAYLLLARWVERRTVTELALRRMVPGLAIGLVGGMLLISAVFCVLWMAGAYQVRGWNGLQDWLRTLLVIGVAPGVAEEIIFRGVLYRLIAEVRGHVWALVVSALLFGGLHMGNPNASLWTSFAIAVEAGLLLGMVYAVSSSLWPCMGLHMAWNFLEGKFFGSPVSGVTITGSALDATLAGPVWLTGGAFGIEASIVTVGLCLAASALLWSMRHRLGPPATASGAPSC